ncbi:TetR/AcrR family transcriptional regulator [Halocynthiibacter styelae]|uniref:TetR/AcrR family transcriptional regulator n=1 Tax=Halocynthiibacter styelae TaxID=2761955 RepID=A0A8J7IF01_9RHOB|nr:TetR family transcriptional regulator [Paenihalocynthiibacter styelae]MBI1495509.1 TetR/AcrR family transcriptional regulator [Paenihalocynthiibacter styelae]
MTTKPAAGRPKEKERVLSRQIILSTALQFVRTNGTDTLTFRALADLLNVTPMAVKYHAGSKKELLFDLLEHAFVGTLDDAEGLTPKTRVKEILEEYCSRALVYPSLLHAVLEDVSLMKGELVRVTDELRVNIQKLDNGETDDVLLHLLVDYTHGFVLSSAAGEEATLPISNYLRGLDWILCRLPDQNDR